MVSVLEESMKSAFVQKFEERIKETNFNKNPKTIWIVYDNNNEFFKRLMGQFIGDFTLILQWLRQEEITCSIPWKYNRDLGLYSIRLDIELDSLMKYNTSPLLPNPDQHILQLQNTIKSIQAQNTTEAKESFTQLFLDHIKQTHFNTQIASISATIESHSKTIPVFLGFSTLFSRKEYFLYRSTLMLKSWLEDNAIDCTFCKNKHKKTLTITLSSLKNYTGADPYLKTLQGEYLNRIPVGQQNEFELLSPNQIPRALVPPKCG